jgi:hypothetical protein
MNWLRRILETRIETEYGERLRRIKQLRLGHDAPIQAEIDRLIVELEERVEREK